LKYVKGVEDTDNENDDFLEDVIGEDWLLKISADNLENYYEIFKSRTNNSKYIRNIPIDYSFLYF
jgi:hypothetical protein